MSPFLVTLLQIQQIYSNYDGRDYRNDNIVNNTSTPLMLKDYLQGLNTSRHRVTVIKRGVLEVSHAYLT
jgi:hypothetical protein